MSYSALPLKLSREKLLINQYVIATVRKSYNARFLIPHCKGYPMLKSFFVKNFRGFEQLTLPSLGRVNLFVGKNNTGKSSLLEALRIYVSGAEPSLLAELTEARDESWEFDLFPTEETLLPPSEPGMRHLFHGFHLPAPNNPGIFLAESKDDPKAIRIEVVELQISRDEEGRTRRSIVTQDLFDDDLGQIEQGIRVHQGDESRMIPLEPNFYDLRRMRRIMPNPSFNPGRVHLVPSSNMPTSSLTAMWDTVNLTELEEEVVKALQIIDLDIQALAMVGDTMYGPDRLRRNARSARIPVVRRKGSGGRIPIKTLGDGMLRMFEISLALINAKGGVLLIDEIENGLHWSIHNQLWDLIFRLSEKLNVQVFATTHSLDCSRAFSKSWNIFPDDGSFFRLEHEDVTSSTIRPIEYDPETLRDSIELDIEVR